MMPKHDIIFVFSFLVCLAFLAFWDVMGHDIIIFMVNLPSQQSQGIPASEYPENP
jgi:hypothetical protein